MAKKKKARKKTKRKGSSFGIILRKNLALTAVVGVSFVGGVWWVSTAPSSLANEAVSLTDTTYDFINRLGGIAQELGSTYDLYPSVMLAQAILESQSGTSGLSVAPYYNLFGIKGQYNGQGAVFETWEDDGQGNAYTVNAEFRQYPSWRASLEDYANLLQLPMYQGAHRSTTTGYQDATAHLTGRYATDTSYGSKLNQIIEAYSLTRFDDASSSAVSTDDSSVVWNPYRRSFTSQGVLDQDVAWLAYLEKGKG